MTSEQRDLARGGALGFVGAATSAALGLLLIVVLGRTLGDAGSGIVLQTIAVFTIALGVARFGMDSTALWILPRLAADRPDQLRRTTRFLVGVSGAVGVVCAGALFAGAQLALAADPADPLATAIRATAPMLPIASMLLTMLSATRALGRVTAYVWVGNIALPAMRPVAVVVAVGIGAGLTGAAVAWASPLFPALFLAAAVLGLQLRAHGPGEALDFRRLRLPRRMIGYAIPRVASASLEQFLIWIAVIVVGFLAGASAAGVYGAASRFVAAGMIVDAALRVVVSPAFSRLQGSGDTEAIESLYRTATVWLVLFSTPVFVLLAAFAPVALSVAGASFAAGEPVLVVMSAGALVALFAGNVHSVLLMSGRSGLAALNKAIVVGLSVALLFALVPLWGIVGAGIAWAVACVVDAALAVLEVRFVLRLRVSLTPGLYPFCIGLACFGAPAVLARLALGASWIGLGAAAAVGAALFLGWCRADRHRLQLHEFGLRLDRGRPGRPVAVAAVGQTGGKGEGHARTR